MTQLDPSSSRGTGRLARVRRLALILTATLALLTAAAGSTLATHDGVHVDVGVYRGSTAVGGYYADALNPGNEVYIVNLWSVSGRDYKRIVNCWGGPSRLLTLVAGKYSVIDTCQLSGQWRIFASTNFVGAGELPTHENDVLVKINVNTAPQP